MNKFLLFTTGGGTSDPLNWDSSEAALYNVKDLESIKPSNARTLDLTFNTSEGKEIVSLKIKNGLQNKIMSSIATAIGSDTSSVVAIADVDGGRYINSGICGVTIRKSISAVQSLSGTTHVKISLDRTPNSIILGATSASVISLWITDITGNDIYDTTINAAEAEAVSTASVTLNVDNTVPTNDLVLNERIYKSDGTFFGVATSWTDASPDTIVFSGGLENAIANNDDLHAGNRYYIFKSMTIPAGSALKLESDEINFPLHKYSMFAQLASGSVDLTARY
jgi:hypothetical protein